MIYDPMSGRPRINLNFSNEQVPKIERQIRVVKQRTISVRHILTFNNTPKLLTIYIVFTVVRMLKYFPFKEGVSAILSPKSIISSETLHYK